MLRAAHAHKQRVSIIHQLMVNFPIDGLLRKQVVPNGLWDGLDIVPALCHSPRKILPLLAEIDKSRDY